MRVAAHFLNTAQICKIFKINFATKLSRFGRCIAGTNGKIWSQRNKWKNCKFFGLREIYVIIMFTGAALYMSLVHFRVYPGPRVNAVTRENLDES